MPRRPLNPPRAEIDREAWKRGITWGELLDVLYDAMLALEGIDPLGRNHLGERGKKMRRKATLKRRKRA